MRPSKLIGTGFRLVLLLMIASSGGPPSSRRRTVAPKAMAETATCLNRIVWVTTQHLARRKWSDVTSGDLTWAVGQRICLS